MGKEEAALKFLELLYNLEDKFFLDPKHPEGAKAFGNFDENIKIGTSICNLKFNVEITKIVNRK